MLDSKPEYNDDFTPEIEQRYLDILGKIDQLNNQYKLAQRYYLNIEDKIKEVPLACLKTSFPPELLKLREQQESILKKGRISKKFLINPESVVSLSEAIFLLAYVRHNFDTLNFFNFQVLLGKVEHALKKQEELDAHLDALGIKAHKHAAKGGKGKAQAANIKYSNQLEAYRKIIKIYIAKTWGNYWESVSHFIEEQHLEILSYTLKDPSLALTEDSLEPRVRRWLREDLELNKLFMAHKKQKLTT